MARKGALRSGDDETDERRRAVGESSVEQRAQGSGEEYVPGRSAPPGCLRTVFWLPGSLHASVRLDGSTVGKS